MADPWCFRAFRDGNIHSMRDLRRDFMKSESGYQADNTLGDAFATVTRSGLETGPFSER